MHQVPSLKSRAKNHPSKEKLSSSRVLGNIQILEKQPLFRFAVALQSIRELAEAN